MRYSLLASAGLAAMVLVVSVSAPAFAGKPDCCKCGCPSVRAPVRHRAVAHHIARREIESDYAQSYYDYHSESRVDENRVEEHSYYHHPWQVAPAGYVEPPPPPYDYYYGYRNGRLDDSFQGGVGYYAEGDAGGGGQMYGYSDGSNGPSYNSYGQSFGGNYGAANRLSIWRGYNFKSGLSNGY